MEVTLVDVLGSDARVVDAARVSFSKKSSNYTEEQNAKLIQYLAKHNHFTPFTHVQITLYQKMPIFVARQFAKHTVGFSTNEVSRRYVDDPPEFYTPDKWRKRAENVKQGSSDEEVTQFQGASYSVSSGYNELLSHAQCLYNDMIENGVAPEQARMVLPQSMYTEMYTTGSLAAWARAYKLRIDSHAQKEIRDLAKEWMRLIGGISELKHSWKALTSE